MWLLIASQVFHSWPSCQGIVLFKKTQLCWLRRWDILSWVQDILGWLFDITFMCDCFESQHITLVIFKISILNICRFSPMWWCVFFWEVFINEGWTICKRKSYCDYFYRYCVNDFPFCLLWREKNKYHLVIFAGVSTKQTFFVVKWFVGTLYLHLVLGRIVMKLIFWLTH